MILILIVRFRAFGIVRVNAVEKLLRLRRSSSDFIVALFLITDYNLAVTFASDTENTKNKMHIVCDVETRGKKTRQFDCWRESE